MKICDRKRDTEMREITVSFASIVSGASQVAASRIPTVYRLRAGVVTAASLCHFVHRPSVRFLR